MPTTLADNPPDLPHLLPAGTGFDPTVWKTNPDTYLHESRYLRRELQLPDRPLALFATAAVRRHLLPRLGTVRNNRSIAHWAARFAEKFYDTHTHSLTRFHQLARTTEWINHELQTRPARDNTHLRNTLLACSDLLNMGYRPYAVLANNVLRRLADNHQTELDNLVRLLSLFADTGWHTHWNTEHTTMLANSIYQLKTWHELPVLADALEEAHCDDHKLLAFLRHHWHHAHRGMFFLDALTGRRKPRQIAQDRS
jgi:hypothetical protein